MRDRCTKLEAKIDGLRAQREKDRRELGLLRRGEVPSPVTDMECEVSAQTGGGSEFLLPPAQESDTATEMLGVLHSRILRVEDLVERLCGVVGSFLPAAVAEPVPSGSGRTVPLDNWMSRVAVLQ